MEFFFRPLVGLVSAAENEDKFSTESYVEWELLKSLSQGNILLHEFAFEDTRCIIKFK